MSDDQYTNMDLDTADELLVRAGHAEIAKALRFQTQGNRNLIQGAWGSQVVSAFENILQVQVVSVLASVQSRLDEQHDLVKQILDSQKASDKNAKQALAVARETTRGLGKLSGEVTALSSAMTESKADRADLRRRIDAITAERAEIEQIKSDIAAIKEVLATQERGGDVA